MIFLDWSPFNSLLSAYYMRITEVEPYERGEPIYHFTKLATLQTSP